MNKVYLVYESNYGELANDCDATQVIGLYADIEKAYLIVNNKIDEYLLKTENGLCVSEYTFVLDEECNDIKEEIVKGNGVHLVRMFENYQENWNSYFEIIIMEMVVE
jgi:hypothetical protein